MSFTRLPRVQRGMVKKLFTKNDKRGREMAWPTIVNEYGEQRCTCFASDWRRWKRLLQEGSEVLFVVDDGILKDVKGGIQ